MMLNLKKVKWYVWLLLALVVVVAPVAVFFLYPLWREQQELKKVPYTGSDQTRGIRNNNPLNLRQTEIKWRGESVKDDDPDFEEFDSMMLGVRAGLRNMRTLYQRDGKNTIAKIVSTWAPSHENDTESYIQFVVNESGYERDEHLNWNSEELYPVVKAMCKIESLYNLEKSLYDEAWQNID
ncbi:hypothetical protein KEM09_12105 [Carboxylicivirga mesophila]|uniref:Uncharacterized protein n=1 Tax=Carboxylicivirga mesophila TaxID=1166478 RepID=A0ABS5KCB9_9BACT|nr:hypothetical protein [Carboxylicivirga mesophila]MBS2212153.1 hypothetical protein [Carboxylicivirga mesophila]